MCAGQGKMAELNNQYLRLTDVYRDNLMYVWHLVFVL